MGTASCRKLIPPIYDLLKKSVTMEVAGIKGKVGITGFVHRSLVWKFDENGLTVTDELKAVRREVELMTRDGIKIIIVVAHAHSSFNTDITKQLKDVDPVVGGHSHRLLYNSSMTPSGDPSAGYYPQVVKGKDGKNIPIVYCGYHGRYVGNINLIVNDDGDVRSFIGAAIHMGHDIEEDSEAKALLEKFRPAVDSKRREVLARCKVYLNNSCYWRECNFGNLVADAYVDYFAKAFERRRYWTDKPIALIRGDFIVTDIDTKREPNRSMTVAHIPGAIPSDENLHCLTLNGSVLRSAMEHAVSDLGDETSPRFLQMSGLRVVFDLRQRLDARVVSMSARCGYCEIPAYKEVKDGTEYNVIMGYPLAAGFANFSMFREAFNHSHGLGVSGIEAIKKYVRKTRAIFTGLEERIRVTYRKYQGGSYDPDGVLRHRAWYLSYVFCMCIFGTFLYI